MISSAKPRIAFVGSDYYRQFAQSAGSCEAELLGAAFAEQGYHLEVVSAYDPQVRWAEFAAVLPLGFWGYHRDVAAFLRWTVELGQKGARLINAPEVLRWNQDKSYLLDLRRCGAPVAPLLHFAAGSRPDLPAALARVGWERYVLKPTVSANAEDTIVASGPPDAATLALADRLLQRCGLLVQPFFAEIQDDGEWSLIFAEQELVHAVIKRPRAGDFRSQPDHGGTVSKKDPSDEVIAQALATVRAAGLLCGPLAYARVDGFVGKQGLQLIELELIEPYLFLNHATAAAPRRLAQAVLRQLG